MKNVYPPLYSLNGEVIKEVDSVRYLGHIISNDGKDDKDIMRLSLFRWLNVELL